MSKLSNKKKIISLISIALLVVIGVAASMISYSIATKGNGDKKGGDIEESVIGDGPIVSLGASGTYVSNIDLIIQKANDASDPQKFNIVEIVPSGVTDDGLSNYVSDEGFSTYVLTGNKSASNTQTMPVGMIKYDKIAVSSTTELSSIQATLDAADLIYINSPGYDSYSGTNNMNEDLYNYLHYFSTGKNKPLVLDYVVKGQTAAANKTYKDFMVAVKRNYVSYRTFPWSDGVTAADFFNGVGSFYLPYVVNASTGKLSGKVLVLSGSDTPESDSVYSKMSGYKDTMKTAAFYGSGSYKPDDITFTIKNVTTTSEADLITELSNTDYNFVVIEKNTSTTTMTKSLYKKLQQVSEASRYMIFDERAISGSTTSAAEQGTSNYLKLMSILVTNAGVSRYGNVLAVSNGFFGNLDSLGASGTAGAKQVADIINRGNYRDANKNGGTSRKYRVLEIEPCYPIDLDLAKKQTTNQTTKFGQAGITGRYYTIPDQVLYGVSKDEIDDNTEYYAFELSLAKVAHFTGLSADQIQIDYMSVNQLISSKPVLSENYDLVYIGGDASALIPACAINYEGTDFNFQTDKIEQALKGITAFDMYTHTGMALNYIDEWNFYRVNGYKNSVSTNGYDINTIKLKELEDYIDAGLPIIIDREVTEAFEESYQYDPNNNDSTKKNRLKQLNLTEIDPDCNMYKFLVYAYGKKATAKNMGWGAIYSPTKDLRPVKDGKVLPDVTAEKKAERAAEVEKVPNSDGSLGNTIRVDASVEGGVYATVYKEKSPKYGDATGEKAIKAAITNSLQRPKLAITDYPMEYVEGDRSTTNTTKTVSFTVSSDVSSKFELYVDKNGDGIYEDSEMKDEDSGTSATLSYDLDDDFFGLVNWKVLAKSTANEKLCDAMNGSAFFKPETDMKKKIRILQIMPTTVKGADGLTKGSLTDGHSLYFCTECQQSGKVIKNNVTVNATEHISSGMMLGANNSASDLSSISVNGRTVNLGKHEHEFGICVYDSTTQLDDWERNFADELTHGYNSAIPEADRKDKDWLLEYGDFEFDLEIVSSDEFDTLCKNADKISDTTAKDNLDAAELMKGQIQDILDGATIEGLAADGATFKKKQSELEEAIYDDISEIVGNSAKFSAVINKGIGTEAEPGQWMRDKQYYKLWEYYNPGVGSTSMASKTLVDAYNAYVEEYNKVIDLKEQYRDLMHKSGKGYSWLANSYDIIVLGLADEFAYSDLEQVSCNQLKDYTENGGSILNSHDSLNALGGGTATRLTATLRKTFGMDRFHVTVSDSSMGVNLKASSKGSKSVNVEIDVPTAKETKLKIGVASNSNFHWNSHEFTVKDQNLVLTGSDYSYGGFDGSSLVGTPTGSASGSTVNVSAAFTNASKANQTVNIWVLDASGNPKDANSPDYTFTTDANGVGSVDVTLNADISTKSKAFTVSDKDATLSITGYDLDNAVFDNQASASKALTDNLKFSVTSDIATTIRLIDGSDSDEVTNTTSAEFTVAQGSSDVSTDITLGINNVTVDWDLATGTVTSTDGTAVSGGIYNVKVNPKNNGTAVADGDVVTARFRGVETTATVTGGVVEFNFDANNTDTNDITSLLTMPTGAKYRKYNTEDSSKYFWTERYKAVPATPEEYLNVENILSQANIYINAPVGISDLIATGNNIDRPTSPYRYVLISAEAYAHPTDSNVNGVNFEGKRGTRKAAQVNKGGVTMYPFAISSDLLIAPTHCQSFSIDIEDPHVAVWYTLAGTFPGSTSSYDTSGADEGFARYVSGMYAASPKDGLNSYFLYSKENVFYTGAGHLMVTGNGKENNDERRLFINVIVNSVTKGKSKPKLKLYNPCDDDTDNCDHKYVDPDDTAANNELKKSKDTLFYNDKEFMYQINVDDSKENIYAEFDFKAIAGSNDISNVKVFFDLDYLDKQTNEYTADANHVMINEYKTNIGGKRQRLREATFGDKLLLKPEYFVPYNNSYTYIVVRAQDKGGTVKSARIKINIIPHLFDLTDATIDTNSIINADNTVVIDFTDKKKFDI